MNGRPFFAISLICFLLVGCGGGGSSSSRVAPPTPPPTTTVNGTAQKGPFAAGATVAFFEVSIDGDVATSPSIELMTDAQGMYEVSIEPGTYLLAIEGVFFNELTDAESDSPIGLHSIVTVGSTGPVRRNANILTHLASDRTLDLIAVGVDPALAIEQAGDEVIEAFEPLLVVDQSKLFAELDLFEADESPLDAALLFLSLLTIQVAADNTAAGQPLEESISNLVSGLSKAFTDPASISNNTQFAEIMLAAPTFVPKNGIDNLNAIPNAPRQIRAGATDSVVDSDLDGEVNSIDLDDDGDQFNDEDEVAIGTNPLVSDTDGDGIGDFEDRFPLDAGESVDTDLDGVGNVADADDDGDLLSDEDEIALGLNPLNSDSDGDGANDFVDLFPLNARESLDTDQDGIGDTADLDDDNDGLSDDVDLNPASVDLLVADQFVSLLEDAQVNLNLGALNTVPVVDRYTVTMAATKGSVIGVLPDVTYRPFENENGSDQIEVLLETDKGISATFRVFITIEAVDDAPSSISQINSQTVSGFEAVDIGPVFDNPDGLFISTTVENLPSWASIDSATARIVGTPTNAEVGSYDDIRMTISNTGGSYTTDPISINVIFQPVIDFSSNLSNAEFTQSNATINSSVDGTSVLIMSEGRDRLGVQRVMLQLFDPLTGEAKWERLLDSSHAFAGSVLAYTDGFVINTLDADFNGLITGINRSGDTLWSFSPTPFTPTNQALPGKSAVLADGRIVVLVSQGNPGPATPLRHKHAFYDPATDILTETNFDSGVPDAPRSKDIVAEADGSYWIVGGNILVPSIEPTDTWVRKYASDDTEMFTTLLNRRGQTGDVVLHPSGGVLLSGYRDFFGGWVGRVDAGGTTQFVADVGSVAPLTDIAVQPSGVYSTITQLDEYRAWSESNQVIQSLTLDRGNGTSQLEAHPDYGVLYFGNGRIRSLPLPP